MCLRRPRYLPGFVERRILLEQNLCLQHLRTHHLALEDLEQDRDQARAVGRGVEER